MKILVIEDEKKIAGFIKKGLEEDGCIVTVCPDGTTGYTMATQQSWDAIVLDIMLPGCDGLSILKHLRQEHNTVPVLVLTARGELDERLEGLHLGADDYLTKPFFMEELTARLQAITRRASGTPLSFLDCDYLRINLITREVHAKEEAVELTRREFSLLTYLLRSPERVFTRTQILEQVWGYDFDPNTNLVDVNIQRIRKKITPDGETSLIQTVRGVGYRMVKKS